MCAGLRRENEFSSSFCLVKKKGGDSRVAGLKSVFLILKVAGTSALGDLRETVRLQTSEKGTLCSLEGTSSKYLPTKEGKYLKNMLFVLNI